MLAMLANVTAELTPTAFHVHEWIQVSFCAVEKANSSTQAFVKHVIYDEGT